MLKIVTSGTVSVSQTIKNITKTLACIHTYSSQIFKQEELLEVLFRDLASNLKALYELLNGNTELRKEVKPSLHNLLQMVDECLQRVYRMTANDNSCQSVRIEIKNCMLQYGELIRLPRQNPNEIRDINICGRLIASAGVVMSKMIFIIDDASFAKETTQRDLISPLVSILTTLLWTAKELASSLPDTGSLFTDDRKMSIEKLLTQILDSQKRLEGFDHIHVQERFMSCEGLLVEIKNTYPE